MEIDNRPAFTLAALAHRWSCSTDVVYDMLRKGILKGFKVGSNWRINAAEVDKYEQGGTVK